MGFFHVNMEEYNEAAAILPLGVWELLLTISFFLIWLDYPDTFSKALRYVLMGIGVLTLIVLAFLYKGGTATEPKGLEPSWWGILGIIGWSYLVCSGAYLVFKGKFSAMVIVLVLVVAVNVAVHGKWHNLRFPVIEDGSSASLMMFGLVVSLLYSKLIAGDSYKRVWAVFSVAGVVMIIAGFIVRPYTQGISKIHSTPAWVFLCTGIGILLFELFIWLVDVEGKKDWFKIIKPAGTSTLTCYLIPYLMVAVFSLINFNYPHFFNFGTGGIIRSIVISFITIFITGFLEKRRLRLKI